MAAADPSGAGTHHLFTLPNLITLARLCAVPATVSLMLNHRLEAAFIVFALAGVSDALDGWLARALNMRSALGAMLDPVADKALLVSVFVMLAVIGGLPDWIAILVVFRDVVILGGLAMLWLLGQRPIIRPLLISKLNTCAQIALAAAALFWAAFEPAGLSPVVPLIWLTAVTTLASGAAYVAGGARLMASPR